MTTDTLTEKHVDQSKRSRRIAYPYPRLAALDSPSLYNGEGVRG